MCVHGRSPVFMFVWCFFFSIHPFVEINIGFKRRSLSDCLTLDWIVFDFLQYIYIKVGEPQVLGKPWVWKTLCEITLMMGSNNLINQNMSRSGWPFTCSGRNKSIKCLVTIGCIQSFLCLQNWVYNARHKIVVFASCAAFGMQQLCLSEPDPSLRRVSSLDIYIHDNSWQNIQTPKFANDLGWLAFLFLKAVKRTFYL